MTISPAFMAWRSITGACTSPTGTTKPASVYSLKMEIVFGEETHITSDAVFKYDAIQPLGLLSYGGELLMSVQKSGKIQRYDPETGDLLGLLAEFPDKEIGRMEIARECFIILTSKPEN